MNKQEDIESGKNLGLKLKDYIKNKKRFVSRISGEPFKNGEKSLMVKWIIRSPETGDPAYTFIGTGKYSFPCHLCKVDEPQSNEEFIENMVKVLEEDNRLTKANKVLSIISITYILSVLLALLIWFLIY